MAEPKTMIKQREYHKWPGKIRHRLASLTLRDFSGMRQALRHDDPVTFVLFEGKTPVAWAMATYDPYNKEYDIMLYVRRDRRRMGYGRKLLGRAKTYVKRRKCEYIVFPDGENNTFFERVGEIV